MSVFLPFIRAYIVDHPVVSIAPFMVVFSFLLLVYLQSSTYKIHADRYLFFLSLFAIHLFLFVLNFDGTETFIKAFFFYMPAIYLVAVLVLFNRNSVNEQLFKFFVVVFWVESAIIFVEVFDNLIGLDVHTLRLFQWHFEVDSRFNDIVLGQGGEYHKEIFDIVPIALGIHGFPHYTAPLYTVSFSFALAQTFLLPDRSINSHIKQFFVIGMGGFCIYMLGVKTHFVSVILVLFISGLFLSRRIYLYAIGIGGIAIILTLVNPWARMRFQNFIVQVFEGNEVQGSRIDVIFNFREYLVFLDLDFIDIMIGTGAFDVLQSFRDSGLFLEQKFLVYGLVFGVPYVLLILMFIVTGIMSGFKLFRHADDYKTKATAIAIANGLLVYGLEMGHYGFTFSAPNLMVIFIMLGMIAALDQSVKRERSLNTLRQSLLIQKQSSQYV